MNFKLVTESGKPIESGLASLFSLLKFKLHMHSGKVIAESVGQTVKGHFQTLPGKHWDPSKVYVDAQTKSNVGVVGIGIPGISRAYHDIDIVPKHSQALTIPLHRDAFKRKATSFNDLFIVKKKDNGKAFLARNAGGSIEMMYVLAKRVHQKKDSGLMPSDDTMAHNAMEKLKAFADQALDLAMKTT